MLAVTLQYPENIHRDIPTRTRQKGNKRQPKNLGRYGLVKNETNEHIMETLYHTKHLHITSGKK